jgi:hypothetical protein
MIEPSACPECGAEIVECQNAVRLDYPNVPYDERSAPWTLMRFGSGVLASVGDPGIGNMGHSLHEHQPKDSVMAS